MKRKHYYQETIYPKDRHDLFVSLSCKYPNHIYILLDSNSIHLNRKKTKFLYRKDSNLNYLYSMLYHIHEIDPHETLSLISEDNKIISPFANISEVYRKHRNIDGFLYFYIEKQGAFG